MTVEQDTFDKVKSFVGFGPEDAARLARLKPVFEKHGPALTDDFYARLGQQPDTAPFLEGEGRVDALKRTHHRWMMELFSGEYGEDYLHNRLRVGVAHVRVELPPAWVEAVMSFVRTRALDAIHQEVPDRAEANAAYGSLCKLLDLDLLIINLAYAEERVDRLSSFTGVSRKLLERAIMMAR